MKNLETLEITELNYHELTTIEGGNPAILVALTAIAPVLTLTAVCFAAFMAGYYIGRAVF